MTHGAFFTLSFSLTILVYAMIFSGESADPKSDLAAFMSGVVILTIFIVIESMIRVIEAAL